ncbi:hypothetical protein HRbin29_01690 [bacterium HR29]|jgi:LysM repeat protein|nr:hypothetical protein HRbin29_01690 [bacterium HR29]
MSDPRCHYCERPAEAECPTCGRLYCADHGEDVCLRCLAPDSVLPSAAVYRGSLLALVIGTLVTIYLLLRPPGAATERDTVLPIVTNTPAVTATATPTPTAAPSGAGQPTAPVGTTAPAPAGTLASGETPVPIATPTPAERTYTVQPGDTLSSIAARFGTTVEAILELNPGVVPEALQPGTQLRLPPAP